MSSAQARKAAKAYSTVVQFESDEQVSARIAERFDVLQQFSLASATGGIRSMIVSGPAGLGKSFTVETTLSGVDPNGVNHTVVKGFVRATGLYRLLHQHSEHGKVLILDDADSVFFDDVCLNLLKAVCDTGGIRRVSWLAEGGLIDEETGQRLPKSFDFNGTVIFITNLDFDAMIEKNHKLTPHLSAMMSRSHYIDLTLKTKRDYLIRIKQVVDAGMLSGLDLGYKADVLRFVEQNVDRLRELSLRMVIKLADIRKMGNNWEAVARVTTCKG